MGSLDAGCEVILEGSPLAEYLKDVQEEMGDINSFGITSVHHHDVSLASELLQAVPERQKGDTIHLAQGKKGLTLANPPPCPECCGALLRFNPGFLRYPPNGVLRAWTSNVLGEESVSPSDRENSEGHHERTLSESDESDVLDNEGTEEKFEISQDNITMVLAACSKYSMGCASVFAAGGLLSGIGALMVRGLTKWEGRSFGLGTGLAVLGLVSGYVASVSWEHGRRLRVLSSGIVELNRSTDCLEGFTQAVFRVVAFAKETELVSRGYGLSAPLPPISRIELKDGVRRVSLLRITALDCVKNSVNCLAGLCELLEETLPEWMMAGDLLTARRNVVDAAMTCAESRNLREDTEAPTVAEIKESMWHLRCQTALFLALVRGSLRAHSHDTVLCPRLRRMSRALTDLLSAESLVPNQPNGDKDTVRFHPLFSRMQSHSDVVRARLYLLAESASREDWSNFHQDEVLLRSSLQGMLEILDQASLLAPVAPIIAPRHVDEGETRPAVDIASTQNQARGSTMFEAVSDGIKRENPFQDSRAPVEDSVPFVAPAGLLAELRSVIKAEENIAPSNTHPPQVTAEDAKLALESAASGEVVLGDSSGDDNIEPERGAGEASRGKTSSALEGLLQGKLGLSS